MVSLEMDDSKDQLNRVSMCLIVANNDSRLACGDNRNRYE